MTQTEDIPDLETMARRQRLEDEADKAIRLGRAQILRSQKPEDAFYSAITMSWRLKPTWAIPTAGVDGTSLVYNPEFITELAKNKDHMRAVLVHEAMHDAHGHHVRRHGRDPSGWNVAADLAINDLITKAGLKLPDCAVMAGKAPFARMTPGLSPEAYYELLPKKYKQGGHGDDPGGTGGVLDPGDGSPSAVKEAEANGRLKLANAKAAALARGKLPGHLSDFIDKLLEPKVDWLQVLRNFLTKKSKTDYSWSPISRRYLSQGFYLPSLSGDDLGDIVFAVDCSGSCWSPEIFTRFASEGQGILEAFSCTLHIIYHDTQVSHVETWTPSDGLLSLRPHGGGGTSHICVFDWLAEQKIVPTCLVALTDLETEFPTAAPEFPVLWATIRQHPVPFGQVVEVEV